MEDGDDGDGGEAGGPAGGGSPLPTLTAKRRIDAQGGTGGLENLLGVGHGKGCAEQDDGGEPTGAVFSNLIEAGAVSADHGAEHFPGGVKVVGAEEDPGEEGRRGK